LNTVGPATENARRANSVYGRAARTAEERRLTHKPEFHLACHVSTRHVSSVSWRTCRAVLSGKATQPKCIG